MIIPKVSCEFSLKGFLNRRKRFVTLVYISFETVCFYDGLLSGKIFYEVRNIFLVILNV